MRAAPRLKAATGHVAGGAVFGHRHVPVIADDARRAQAV
jgi:hypothetical protein